MLSNFQAHSDIRGHRIDVGWTWSGADPRPNLRLVRQRRAFSSNDSQGLTVFDLDEDFAGVDGSTIRMEQELFLGNNSVAESKLPMAELGLHYDGDSGKLVRARVGIYDTATPEYHVVLIDEVSRVTIDDRPLAPWNRVVSWEIYASPGGGSEISMGRFSAYLQHEDGVTSDCVQWQATGQASMSVDYAHRSTQRVHVQLDERFDASSGDFHRAMVVQDDGLEPQVVYYYTLFVETEPGSGSYRSQRDWRAAVMATGRYALGERLYRLLPSLHAYYDEQEPSQRGSGTLRRFLAVGGAAADQARGLAEGLQQRHHVRNVHADALPHLASWIGWEPDLTADALTLRSDVLQAPEIFRTVGTASNLRALVNRVTGWDCRVKEFAENVFLSNAPETIRLWEIHERIHDQTSWSSARRLTRTDGFDGWPTSVDHGGYNWLVFHSDRTGRRDIWIQPVDLAMGDAYSATLFNDQQLLATPAVNEYPALLAAGTRLWLFWSSNQSGYWDIWGAWDEYADEPSHSGWNLNEGPFGTGSGPEGKPENLSSHSADDRNPVAVGDDADRVWLFWQSNRRGPTDIWTRVYQPSSGWGVSQRVTRAELQHLQPSATFDASGRLWLVFCEDLGDRTNLRLLVHEQPSEGAQWDEAPVQVTKGDCRDEAPAIVQWGTDVWLFWHSDRDGHWQIWGQVWQWQWDGTNGKPEEAGDPFCVSTGVTGDKDPKAYVDADSRLRLVWRSQQRGTEYRSRTIDLGDPEMMVRLGGHEDRAHYTYDTGRGDGDWYARDTVGIILDPRLENRDDIDRSRRLVEGPLRRFIPIHVRPVFVLPDVYQEYVYTYDAPDVLPQRRIGWDFDHVDTVSTHETHAGIAESYLDRVPQWVWFYSWSLDDSNHRTVDVTALPIDTSQRTWHIGVSPGG